SDATKNSATATLTNKTISGANNTITDLPASATPDAARLVATTALGGGTTEDGANTWAKLATIEITELYRAINLLLSVSGARNNTASSDSAVIAVYAEVNFNTPGIANRSNVDIIASSGSTFGPDSFKIISDGYGSPYQLWMRKTSSYSGFRISELNRAVSPTGVTLTYHDGATWQSATPTGAVTNVQSNGVTAFGTPVVTTSETQTLSNKTISGASNTLSNIPQSAVTNLTSDLSNTYSQLKTRVQAGNNIVTNPNYENTSLIQNYGVLSTTQKRSGTYSFKITGTGALQYPALTTTATEYVRINVRQGQKFYYEFWIYGDDANTITSGTSELISLGLWFYNAAGAYQTNAREWTKGTGDTIGVGSWVMISGTLTVPANSNITNMGPLFYVTSAMTAGNSYYIDDVVLREVTEIGNTNQALYGTDTPGANILDSALPSTMASKTLTSSVLTTPAITDPAISPRLIVSNNNGGRILFAYGSSTDANPNYIQINNGNPGGYPSINAVGGDTDIELLLSAKGSGKVVVNSLRAANLYNWNSSKTINVNGPANAVNFMQLNSAVSGQPIVMMADGTDTNVSINLIPKGSGTVKANNVDIATISGTQTLTNKTLTSPTLTGASIMPTGWSATSYNTADQVTNYERVASYWSGNSFYLAAATYAGTGVRRAIRIDSGGSLIVAGAANYTGTISANVATGTPGGVQYGVLGTLSASSGIQYNTALTPTINQSGTAGYTTLFINPTETSTGSGTKLLIDARVGGVSKFSVDSTGNISSTGNLSLNGESVLTGVSLNSGKQPNNLYMVRRGTRTSWISGLHNDLAYLVERGGAVVCTLNGVDQGDKSNLFRGATQFLTVNATSDVYVLEITLPTIDMPYNDAYTLGCHSYGVFAQDVKIEIYRGAAWTNVYEVTNTTEDSHWVAPNPAASTTKYRFTFTNFVNTNPFRLMEIFSICHQSYGLSVRDSMTTLPRNGGSIYGTTALPPTLTATGSDTNIDIKLTAKGTGVVKANNVEVATISATQTLSNKTLADPVYTGQMVGGDYARTSTTLHLMGGASGSPILQMSRGSGVTASNTFDFAISGGGFSIRDVLNSYSVAANFFANASNSWIYIGQAASTVNLSTRPGILSAGTHSSSAGTDVNGPPLYIHGGGGTGAGTPGSIYFKTYPVGTSGTTPHSNSMVTRATIDGSTGVMTIATPGTVAGSVASVDGTQTLTNKTLTSPVISTISNTGTLTLPTSTGTIALTSDITAAAGGMLAPVQGMVNTETLTISSGSVTQIAGTTVNGYTPAVGDRILIANAPASSGAASSYSMTSQPGNGIYTVTNNTTNLTVSRTSDMSGSVKPGGLAVNVENATWPASNTIFYVETPSNLSAFTWGTTSMSWKWSGGISGQTQQVWISNSALSLNIYNGTGWSKVLTTTNAGTQTLTLPATATSDTLVGRASTDTLTNKRVNPRAGTTASSATPTINTDDYDIYGLTAQAVDITSFTTNLSGTPVDGQKLWVYIVGTASRAITWGASFENGISALPTTTTNTERLDVEFIWNAASSAWRCIRAGSA
ncbi:hypothetical protein KC953_00215, partial [Candidatus Saccharibacteria bacterium]|nr:hypothetical protein [Candidatus Saccharibacteria bacterium]